MDEQTSLRIMKLIALLGDKLIFRYEILYEVAYHLIANGVTIPVRCKDCKHFGGHGACHCHAADENGTPIFVREDDFCSYGERRTDDE